ncbi:PRC-barrel domain-containing protein [Bacillus sp. FJAT-45037]|uniref:PRC-barrel domain-containing protein n=1 Tax=Bacillus sp. FJAT-45037 TaxID=2011007 RepID=UPI0018E21525|nr:PRC-barrel domain-containing protein [Bacillus sp. FJAT-45037]
MLLRAKDLKSYSMLASDGELGSLDDFYFDSDTATIRYFVGDTRTWFFGGKVLLSPLSFSNIDRDNERIAVKATKDQIKDSPKPEEHEPVTRKYEKQLSTYYGWEGYWGGADRPRDMTGFQAHAPMMPPIFNPEVPRNQEEQRLQADAATVKDTEFDQDQHLISVEDIKGYTVYSKGGEVGKIHDCVIDDKTWKIRYFVVNVGGFFNKELVLVSVEWLTDVDWKSHIITVGLDNELIENAPELESGQVITVEDETKLHVHYNRPTYWQEKN